MPTFTNTTGITFIDNGTVSQTVAVSGITNITQVAVTLSGLTHAAVDDLDFLLVGPDGLRNLLFWSDAGDGTSVTGVSVNLADGAATLLPIGMPPVNGTTYRPADYAEVETDADFGSATGAINHPVSNGVETFVSAFGGNDPTGLWTLYARDDQTGAVGSLASWSLVLFNDLAIVGTAGPDTLVITATGPDSGTYSFNGGGPVAFSGITSLNFDGRGSNDVLTINNPGNGLLSVPIVYEGGSDPGDALELIGGQGTSTVYTATGVNSGTIAHTANEVQSLFVGGGAGTFSLTFNGQTTPPLSFDANAVAIAAALNALSSIGGIGGTVAVEGAAGTFSITFGGSLAGTNVAQTTASVAGGATVVINTAVQGGTQNLSFSGLAPATDTVTEATFTIIGTAGADTITITDGGLVGGDQTWVISSPTFESMRISNKNTLIIDGNGGGDTVVIDTGVTPTGLQALEIRGVNSVSNGAGVFNVQTLRIEAANSVELGAVNDVSTFSAQVTNSGGQVTYHDANGFTVDGISTNGGAVTLAADAASITIGTAALNSGIDTGSGNIVRLQATTGTVGQTDNGAIVASLLGVRAGANVVLDTATNDSDATRSMPAGWSPIRTATT